MFWAEPSRRWRHSHQAPALSIAIFVLSGCASLLSDGGGGPPPFTVQPKIDGVPAGTSIAFTASGSVDTSHAVWNLNGNASNSLGSFTPAIGSSVVYTAPSVPPLYSGSPDPLIQGTVTLRANLVGDTADAVTFHVTAPTVSAGISPKSATIAVGTSKQFYGYAVGAVNNAVSWQINGIDGGNDQLGTVSPTGLYIAPTSAPTGVNTITLKLISEADPTITAIATITLN